MLTPRLRSLVLGCAALLALAAASSAAAAFVPRLSVSHSTMSTGSRGSQSIRVTIPADNDALAKATIFAPLGYAYNFAQAPGTQLGTLSGQVQVSEPVAGAVVPFTGTIVADAPSNHTASACAPGVHTAVWILVLQVAGQELRVPMYVDEGPSPATGFVAAMMQICLPSPHIPASAGGAAFGAKLVTVQLNVDGVRAPTNMNHYVWKGAFTPWAPPATPNVAGTVEARGIISFPAALSLQARVANPARRIVAWSGLLSENGVGVAGARIEVRQGNRLKARTTTTRTGAFKGTLRLARGATITLQVRAVVPERLNRPSGCTDPVSLPAPGGCVSETRAFFTLSSARVRLKVP
jgi:hypothetical protein